MLTSVCGSNEPTLVDHDKEIVVCNYQIKESSLLGEEINGLAQWDTV